MPGFARLSRRLALKLFGGSLAASTAVGSEAARAEGQEGPGSSGGEATEGWDAYFAGQRIWAYADRTSLVPGQTFDLMIAAGPGQPARSVRAEFFRIGPGEPTLVWRSPAVEVGHIPIGKTASAVGAAWPPALWEIDTGGWPAGCYSVDIVEELTGVRDLQAVQLILRSPAPSSDILLRLGTNTYQAYNRWGGHSLYPTEDLTQRGVMVSFDRPCGPSFFEYDVFLVRWIEGQARRLGISIDYASNFDVHARPDLLDHHKLVICGAHDEYWSREEFDAFERRIFTEGGNTAFFGANTAYFQARYLDVNQPPNGEMLGRQLICYKSMNDPIVRRESAIDKSLLPTAMFRAHSRRPETMLTGAAYQGWFEPGSEVAPPYRVAAEESPLFHGTGLKNGDRVADVVGYEWDNRDPDGDGMRLFAPETSRNTNLPIEQIQVLMRGNVVDIHGRPGVAEAVYFESAAGAKVFNAGSIRWSWGFGKPGFEEPAFRTFNENVLSSLLS